MSFFNILVTGAAGFIGANLVRSLIEKNAQIHIIQKPSSDFWRLEDCKSKLIFHQEQLSDRKKLAKLLQKIHPEVIYHLAAHGSYPGQTDVDKMVASNILGTLNLLFALKDVNYRCLVNTGSSSEYGIKSKPMQEKDVCQPLTFYGATKLSTTVLCQVFAKIFHKPIVTFRPFSVYGPYEKESRFIPTIIRSLIKKKPIRLTSGTIRRDFIYVEDVVNAYLKAPDRIDKLKGNICNIGTGKEHTNDEVVKILFQITKREVPVKKGAFPPRMWDTTHWRADILRTRKLLGWQPRFSLKKGLNKMFKWFLINQSLYAKNKRSRN